MKGKCLTILTLVLLASLLLTPAQATLTRYIWDNVHFMEGRDDEHDIKYPHPDRDYYDISRYTSWSIRGTKLYHEQMDHTSSQTAGGSVVLVCGAIGTAIALIIGPPYGAAIGIVAGVALGVIAVITNLEMQDEEGCIWWWISGVAVDWLKENDEMLGQMAITNPIGMYYLILDNLLFRGYLRLGSVTLWDAIDAGNPSPPTRKLYIYTSSGGTTDPAPGTYTYDYGSSVTVNATAYSGYYFNYWLLGGVTKYDNPITVTMNSDHVLEAHFNSPPNTPSLTGPTSGHASVYYTYKACATDPDGDSVKYTFYWGDGYTTTGYYASGVEVSRSHSWGTGIYSVKVMATDVYGAYKYSLSLTVTISTGGDGGGCPMLYVYDGTEYFCEGLLDIHNPEGIDVVYEHTLVSTPQRVNGAYLMRLTEHPQTHSYIDQVKLYAILEDKTVIELPLIWAWHSEDGNVLPQLLHSDEWKADTLGADHNNGTSQSIDLKFAAQSSNLEIVGFVFQIEGNNIEFKP